MAVVAAGNTERPLPNNLEAERSVLGAILLDNHALDRAIEKSLKPEDFFLDQHRRIFDRMIALSEANHAIDLVTLTDDLHRRNELEAAGGPSYISTLVDGVPAITNVEHYARIVKEKALLRSLAHTTYAIQQQALAGEEDADALLDRAESSIFELADDRIRAGFIGVKDLVRENYERLEQIFTSGRQITGLATGYTRLDERTSGLQPSELIIIAARP
ncbi:MAG: DnaB-like helicase N-terminal domain-containing protein, partial [Candidatus Acidiferrales bacterium]